MLWYVYSNVHCVPSASTSSVSLVGMQWDGMRALGMQGEYVVHGGGDGATWGVDGGGAVL